MPETALTPEMMKLANDTVDAEILKAITEYADLDRQSEKITAKRTKIRDRMEKDHGYSSLAFQEVVRKVKKMTTEERLAHEEQVARGLRVAGVLVQAELWPEMAKKAAARKSKREKAAAKAAAAAASKTAEDIERGDPKRGGAGGANGRGKAKDGSGKKQARGAGRGSAAARAEETSERNAKLADTMAGSAGAEPGQMADAEQTAGGAILDGAIDGIKSQSAKAKDKLGKLGLT